MMLDFKGLNAQLIANAQEFLCELFPAGYINGQEFCIGSLDGEPGQSLRVNMATGVWADFAADVSGADLISLYAAKNNLTQAQAYNEIKGTPKSANNVEIKTTRSRNQEAIKISKKTPNSKPNINPNSTVYKYCEGFYVSRFTDKNGKKQFTPHTFTDKGWVRKAPSNNRPLFKTPTERKNILLVEGEKCVLAAQKFALNKFQIATWQGGSNAVKKTNWEYLFNKNVFIWPDNDEAGYKACQKICEILHGKSANIKIIDVAQTDKPKSWDAADSNFDEQSFLEWAKPITKPYEPPKTPEVMPKNEYNSFTESVPVQHNNIIITDNPDDIPSNNKTSMFGLFNQLNMGVTASGQPHPNLINAGRLIDFHFGDDFLFYDTFHNEIFINFKDQDPRPFMDADIEHITMTLQKHYDFHRLGSSTVHGACKAIADLNKKSTPLEWMKSLKWDGTSRAEMFFQKYFGAKNNKYTRAVSKNFLVSIAARIARPGCKVDNMVILEGEQGARKSSGLGSLAQDWFNESNESINSKEFFQSLSGSMIVEIAELDSFSKAEVNTIKKVVTTQVDKYRPPYGRVPQRFPRQCVFVGTTNEEHYLRDATGARRFWPLKIKQGDTEALATDREQIFAEAYHLFKSGENWYDVPSEASSEQALRYDVDIWEETIAEFLLGRSSVTVGEIATSEQCLAMKPGQLHQGHRKRIYAILKRLEWKISAGHGRSKVFTPIAGNPQIGHSFDQDGLSQPVPF